MGRERRSADRGRRTALATLTIVAVLLGGAPAAASARTCDDGASWNGRSSTVGGTSVYDRGEFIHQDYIYDDFGAETAAPQRPVGDTGATPAGSYAYPGADNPRYLNNGADLRELRLRLEGEVLAVRVALNTLTAPDAAVVGLALDLDDDPGGGPMTWPHGAQLTTADTDAVITFWGSGADLTRRGEGAVALSAVCADVGENVLEVRVPLAALGDHGQRWRVHAASGIWDPAAEAWGVPVGASPASPRAFDIGFVPGEGENDPDGPGAMNWFDVKQAAALAAGDIDAYAGTVDLDVLRSQASRPFVARPGFYEVVYRSSTTLEPDHEGWRSGGRFQGRFQPYSLYVPTAVESGRPLGLFAYFHGATRNHTQFVSGSNMQQQLGERLGLALVGVLGRGGLGGTREAQNVIAEAYQGPGMLDAREVLADVRGRLAIDPRRQYVGGYSMGGIATYQLAGLNPDEWAGAVIWAGTKPQDTDAWLAGARWVPVLFLHAPADEVVSYRSSFDSAEALRRYGYEHALHSHPGEHEWQLITDDYRQPADWIARLRSPVDPPRITYPRAPRQDAPALGLRQGGAYWISGVTTEQAIGTLDLTTHALGGAAPGLQTVGPSVEDDPPAPYVRTGLRYVWPGTPYPQANELSGTMPGITRAVVDGSRAGLDPSAPIRLRITTDGPAELTLTGLCETLPTISGDASVGGTAKRVVVRFAAAGAHEARLSPCGDRTGADRPVACRSSAGFRAVAARRAGRGLRFAFRRRVSRPVTVDVFQISRGRRILGERLVARFADRKRAFTWDGRSNRRGRRVRDGVYYVRYRIATPGGPPDVRRIALRRSRGRFSRRPSFYRRASCGLLRSFRLERPVFGGRTNRALGIAYRLGSRARVRVTVLRGRRVVRRYPTRTRAANDTVRLRFDSERRPRGDYRVRVRAEREGRAVTSTLTARKL